MTYSNQIDADVLKAIIKESIQEVLPDVLSKILKEERLKLSKLLVPMVSDEEQDEIEREVGLPSDFDEADFVDLTEWTDDESHL